MDRHETSSWWWDDVPAHLDYKANRFYGKVSVDVCVIGAGITGITTAYLLQKQGYDVVVIDAAQIGGGETSRTTAHLSYVVDAWLPRLAKRHGASVARSAWAGARLAIDLIENHIVDEGLSCDFRRVNGYLFTDEETEPLDELEAAAQTIGFRCRRSEPLGMSFRPKSILEFPDQARFHPLKYVHGLAAALVQRGGRIHSFSPVTSVTKIDDSTRPICVKVDGNGSHVMCQKVVIAAHVPFNNRVFLHTKQASYRSYAIGVGITKGSFPDVLLQDLEDPYHYVRLHPRLDQDLLIVGGEDHKTGQEPLDHGDEHFERLLNFARDVLGVDGELVQTWSGQIVTTLDGLPHIGLNINSDHEYVATGFAGDGMTFGTLAAHIISERIMGRQTAWDKVFDPQRTEAVLKDFVAENSDFATYMVKDRLTWAPALEPDSLRPGEGAIMRVGGKRLAVARDENGHLFAVSPTCTHLGCVVHWNGVEKTWDCPCHGSRFAIEGTVINGPAATALEREILDDDPHRSAQLLSSFAPPCRIDTTKATPS